MLWYQYQISRSWLPRDINDYSIPRCPCGRDHRELIFTKLTRARSARGGFVLCRTIRLRCGAFRPREYARRTATPAALHACFFRGVLQKLNGRQEWRARMEISQNPLIQYCECNQRILTAGT